MAAIVALVAVLAGNDESELERLLAADACTSCEDFEWLLLRQDELSGGFLADAADRAWGLVKTVAIDAAYLFTSPLRFNSRAIVPAIAVIGILGVSAALDEPLHRWVEDHRTERWDRFFDRFEQPGNNAILEASVVAIGALTWATGLTDSWVLDMGLTAFEARVFGTLAVDVVKDVVGRRRPSETDDAFHFHFRGGDRSFPSGHVINVVPSLVVMMRYVDRWWFDVLAWGLVALKAAQRIEGENHWLSDTVGSVVVGWLIGNALADRHLNPGLKLLPWTGDDGDGGGCLGLQFQLCR